MPKILVVDDERAVRHFIRRVLDDTGSEFLEADDPQAGLDLTRQEKPDLVFLDVMLPKVSGIQVLRDIQKIDAKLPVILVTANESSLVAIEAMAAGAYEYLVKPLDASQIRQLARQALEMRRLMNEPVQIQASGRRTSDEETSYADQVARGGSSASMVGRSPVMLNVYKAIGRSAPLDVTVLIRGESGTGKELVARALYHHSGRAEKPYLALNCAAIPENLLESELFGHEKGAFSSAMTRRIGKFEQCSGGTIFLDEIGDMSLHLQSKMLRLLQEQTFERVGGNQTIQTDVRILAATHRDLEQMVEDGEFREDLFYRLNAVTIWIPPLRERTEDLFPLIEHGLTRLNNELGKSVEGLTPQAVDCLVNHRWPGNVRELLNALRHAMIQANGTVLIPDFFPESIRQGNDSASTDEQSSDATVESQHVSKGETLGRLDRFLAQRIDEGTQDLYEEALEIFEKSLLTHVLRHTSGNQSQASRILGISRGNLRSKIKALDLSIGRITQEDADETSDGSEATFPNPRA